MTINTEYLAISVIFIGGMYVGFKFRELIFKISQYYSKREP